MEKRIYAWLRIALPIIGILIGTMKIMGTELEVKVFQGLGVPEWFRIVFGTAQILGGVIIYFPKLEVLGITVSMLLLALATTLMLYHHMLALALVPVTGITVLLVFAYSRAKTLSINRTSMAQAGGNIQVNR